MGKIMQEDDVYINNLFELLNLRFAPPQGYGEDDFGGIEEMVALQKEFRIFREGRSLRDSAAIMNLGGFWNTRARNRWYRVLADLNSYESNIDGVNGDEAIVASMIGNLASRTPLPVYFKAHDSRVEGMRRVFVESGPIEGFFIDVPYLTISLPMRPRDSARAESEASNSIVAAQSPAPAGLSLNA